MKETISKLNKRTVDLCLSVYPGCGQCGLYDACINKAVIGVLSLERLNAWTENMNAEADKILAKDKENDPR